MHTRFCDAKPSWPHAKVWAFAQHVNAQRDAGALRRTLWEDLDLADAPTVLSICHLLDACMKQSPRWVCVFGPAVAGRCRVPPGHPLQESLRRLTAAWVEAGFLLRDEWGAMWAPARKREGFFAKMRTRTPSPPRRAPRLQRADAWASRECAVCGDLLVLVFDDAQNSWVYSERVRVSGRNISHEGCA